MTNPLGVVVLTRRVRGPHNTCPHCGHNCTVGFQYGGCLCCGTNPVSYDGKQWDSTAEKWASHD